MQLKIVTHGGTFRYNQSGQPISEITEPFVLVEVYTKEDVVALYDQGQEHLANAFTYQDDQITGVSADAGDHIQNFRGRVVFAGTQFGGQGRQKPECARGNPRRPIFIAQPDRE
jgi:hypothetical protein